MAGKIKKSRKISVKSRRVKPINSECPICLYVDKTMPRTILACKHFMHTPCIQGLISLECPLCKKPIEKRDVPDSLYDKLVQNRDADRERELERERHELAQTYEMEDGPLNSLAELLLAQDYIRELGFNLRPLGDAVVQMPLNFSEPESSCFGEMVYQTIKAIQGG
jgi:hypothetical protein